jgi:hypothetical protein
MEIKREELNAENTLPLEAASSPEAVLKGVLGEAEIIVDPVSMLLIRRLNDHATVIYPISLKDNEIADFENKLKSNLNGFDCELERLMIDALKYQYDSAQSGISELLQQQGKNYIVGVLAKSNADISTILDIFEEKFQIKLSNNFREQIQ